MKIAEIAKWVEFENVEAQERLKAEEKSKGIKYNISSLEEMYANLNFKISNLNSEVSDRESEIQRQNKAYADSYNSAITIRDELVLRDKELKDINKEIILQQNRLDEINNEISSKTFPGKVFSGHSSSLEISNESLDLLGGLRGGANGMIHNNMALTPLKTALSNGPVEINPQSTLNLLKSAMKNKSDEDK